MLEHVFAKELSPEVRSSVLNCTTFEQYLNNLRSADANVRDFAQHGFQALVEAILKFSQLVPDYRPHSTTIAKRTGVQGAGNSGTTPCAVGVIYRPSKNEHKPLVAATGVTEFFDDALDLFPNDNGRLLLFTNAPGLHERTVEQFVTMQNMDDMVSVYNKENIAAIVDDNEEFWEFFRQQLTPELPALSHKKLRKFQRESVRACKGKIKGQILLPTGTGKTLIEGALIENKVRRRGDCRVCVICSPRIILTYQHLDEISEFLISRKVEARYLNLNSGDKEEERIKEMMFQQGMLTRDIPSTTSSDELKRIYNECVIDGVSLVIGATYHSFPRLFDAGVPIDLKLADEAHNLVDGIGRFATTVKTGFHKVKAKQTIFMTATQATSPHVEGEPDVGTGMQNRRLFGPVLYSKTPKQMIEAGEIVPPYIHIAEITQATLKSHNMIVNFEDGDDLNSAEVDEIVIMECFERLEALHKQYSCHPKQMGVKLLVTFQGQPAFEHFFNSQRIREWAAERDISLAGMSSESGAFIDGEHIHPRGESFKERFQTHIANISPIRRMIVGHIDMIGEGINIPTLTGVLPFRDLGTIKSAQTLGRAMRLFDVDRQRFYAGEIKARETAKMIKPYAWVVVPFYKWDRQDGASRIKKMAHQIRSDLGYNPVEMGNGQNCDGRKESFDKDPRLSTGEVDALDIVHEIENPEFEERMQVEMELAEANPAIFKYWTKYRKGRKKMQRYE